MRSSLVLFSQQCRREVLLQARQLRFLVNTSLFMLIFLFVFPLTIRPEVSLLRTIVPGVVWLAVLLSMLLSADRLFQQDFEQGVMEQWIISGHSLPILVSAKIIAHWLFNLLPWLLLCPFAALLYSLSCIETCILVLTLLCGTPALLFLCALVSAFGMGINQRSVLMALILLPLTLPILVFGCGALSLAMQGSAVSGYLALLLAMSCLAVSFLPFAIAGIVRISHMD